MSKSHKYDIYPLRIEIVEQFLGENGFTPIEIGETFITREKKEIKRIVRIPKETALTKTQIKEVLSAADLEFSEFEYYLLHHTNDFDQLIDMSLRTPPFKKDKDVK
jgi:hypothetical protein